MISVQAAIVLAVGRGLQSSHSPARAVPHPTQSAMAAQTSVTARSPLGRRRGEIVGRPRSLAGTFIIFHLRSSICEGCTLCWYKDSADGFRRPQTEPADSQHFFTRWPSPPQRPSIAATCSEKIDLRPRLDKL